MIDLGRPTAASRRGPILIPSPAPVAASPNIQPLLDLALEAALGRVVEFLPAERLREIVLARKRIGRVVVICVARAVAFLLHQPGRRIEDMLGRQQRARLLGDPPRSPKASSRSRSAVFTCDRAQIERLCGLWAARRVAKEAGSLLPPKHILNAPTRLMQTGRLRRELRIMTTTRPMRFRARTISRRALGRQKFYDPPERGFEREIRSGWIIGRSCDRSGARNKDRPRP